MRIEETSYLKIKKRRNYFHCTVSMDTIFLGMKKVSNLLKWLCKYIIVLVFIMPCLHPNLKT
jgi:hypothetical protein